VARIYISHNHANRELVVEVATALRERRHELQLDPVVPGEGGDWDEIMREQLATAEAFVVFVSEASMQSGFVNAEIGAARFRRETGSLLMIAVIVDGTERPSILHGVRAIRAPERDAESIAKQVDQLIANDTRPGIDLFVSHAHRDVALAKQIVTALEVGLEVPRGSIRCTSVPGYKLDLGAMPHDQLARGLNATRCVLAIVTPSSLASQWVLFELGATWALAKSWIPLLAPGLRADDLPGPLRGAAAASLSDEGGLRAARDQIGTTLRWEPRSVAASDGLLADAAGLAGKTSYFENDVQSELTASFAAKRAGIGPTQGSIVDNIANRPGRPEFSLDEIAAAFPKVDRGSLYYRLEQLRFLGFLSRRGAPPNFKWACSAAYGDVLGRGGE